MKKVLLYIWQLPQNILGLIAVVLFRCSYASRLGVFYTEAKICVSLGNYIIVNEFASILTVKHEQGHSKQSLMLGPLYLFVIGIPSAVCNIIDRCCHKNWTQTMRERWYYSLPWESSADKLADVKRW